MVLLTVRTHGRNKRENVIYRAHEATKIVIYRARARSRTAIVMYRARMRMVIIVPETYLPCARP